LNKADAKRWTQLEGLRALRASPDAENVEELEQLSAVPADFIEQDCI
jgi:hypothetical protein